MPNLVEIYQTYKSSLIKVGVLDRDERTFRYDTSFLETADATQLSFSLPLQSPTFSEVEFRPYFEGLLPEGIPRRELAQELALPEEDYLSILADCGLDCVGDIVIDRQAYTQQSSYEPIAYEDIKRLVQPSSMIESSVTSRLSLAGTQRKVGLFHDDELPVTQGWARPVGGAASTHILKPESLPGLAVIEYLLMKTAAACSLHVAQTHLLDVSTTTLCSKRFDRSVIEKTYPKVARFHQEDLTQAFGILPGSKYAELTPSTASHIASFLRAHSMRPLRDIAAFAQITCYNYLIGNCDNHLKNLSLLYHADGNFVSLSPAYDLVCTTMYERFSRRMGMKLGSAEIIDEVTPDHLIDFAKDLEMTHAGLASLCKPLIEHGISNIKDLSSQIAEVFPIAPYVADDLEEDIAPRLEVLKSFCQIT